MKIIIGSVIDGWCGNKKRKIALEIPGIGVVNATEDKEQSPFQSIILDKEQLIALRSQIDIELGINHGRI